MGCADNFHTMYSVINEGIKWHHGENGAHGFGRGCVINPQELAKFRFPRHGVGWKIRIRDDQIVAMPHGAQRIKHIGIQQWIDVFKHELSPLLFLKSPRPYSP